MDSHSAFRPRGAIAAAGLLLASVLLGAEKPIDPDPELFDGTRTKTQPAEGQDRETTVDDWENGNLIVYDETGETDGRGGQGRRDGQGPGFEIGSPNGMPTGVPMQMPAGAEGMAGQPQQIPAGAQSTPQTGAVGQVPPSQADLAGAQPGEVEIGDPGSQIKTTAQNVPAGSGRATEQAPESDKGKNEDTTQIPQAASGQQSGTREGGVEKGEPMPTDI